MMHDFPRCPAFVHSWIFPLQIWSQFFANCVLYCFISAIFSVVTNLRIGIPHLRSYAKPCCFSAKHPCPYDLILLIRTALHILNPVSWTLYRPRRTLEHNKTLNWLCRLLLRPWVLPQKSSILGSVYDMHCNESCSHWYFAFPFVGTTSSKFPEGLHKGPLWQPHGYSQPPRSEEPTFRPSQRRLQQW